MLNVTRVAAKVDPMALFNKKIRIDNAQLFGTNANLYKRNPEEAANFQFVIDAFKSNDTTSSSINLKIGRLLVRRANIKYDLLYKPETPGKFNPNHLQITDLSFNASLDCFMSDSINARIRRFGFKEKSGLTLSQLELGVCVGKQKTEINNFRLALPNTELSIPLLAFEYPSLPEKGKFKDWLNNINSQGNMILSIQPNDLSSLVPKLKFWKNKLSLSSNIQTDNGYVEFKDFTLQDKEQILNLTIDGRTDFYAKDAQADIKSLVLKPGIYQFLSENLQGKIQEENAILARLQQIETKGLVKYSQKTLSTHLNVSTALGIAHIDGKLSGGNDVSATIQTENFELGKLLGEKAEKNLKTISFSVNGNGELKDARNKTNIQFNGVLNEFFFKDYAYRNATFSGHYADTDYALQFYHNDPNAQIALRSVLQRENGYNNLFCTLKATGVNLHAMNLTKKLKGEHISLNLDAELGGSQFDNMQGKLALSDAQLLSDSLGLYQLGDIIVEMTPHEKGKSLNVESKILNAAIKGMFKWKNIPMVFEQITSNYVPLLFRHKDIEYNDDIAFALDIQDTILFERLTGTALAIPETAKISGKMTGEHNALRVDVNIPELRYGKETLKAVDMNIQSSPEMLQTSLNLKRMMKNKPVDLGLNAYMGYDKVRTTLSWNNNEQPKQGGDINATGILFTGRDGKLAVHTKMASSEIVINDTIWQIHPSIIEYHDGVVDVKDFQLTQADRFVKMNGRMSKEPSDSLTVLLNKIRLEYVFDIIKFNAVEFGGDATGTVYAKQIMKSPIADAYLNVGNFTFNKGKMGNLDIYGNWGNHDKSIFLDADIKDPEANHQTKVRGTITPGKGTRGGLDLSINTRRINLFFLNKFTEGIFDNLQGRATGNARIFGPFKLINIEGDLVADEVSLGLPILGTRYRLYGDSITLRPNNIWIRNATVYDQFGHPGNPGHQAKIDGHLMHDYFKNLRYNFNIKAENLLGYDIKEFGDESFYGTVFANGNVNLSGRPGLLEVDINATPLVGTQFVYNVSTPETLTEAGFITYKSKKDRQEQGKTDAKATETDDNTDEDDEESDIRLDFDLDITPEVSMNLLMDPKSGDNINLNGTGRIRAHYYNKGKFRMYGIYNVNHGVYKLSLQDFIRKDFIFQKGGTITFGGDAYQAALNLQAVYTVPNVSLDDLSATSLGLSNTRVDCIMNITGRPSAPAVSFDFDLPNANEDEKQMVRSMVSTEEEKNMQAVYLLGIGRFYNYNAQYLQGNARQSSTAMNSLISSTLSSQFNQMMSNMVGNSNWSFGANLRTGETGWEELDVEGMLSGRFLNNRLLFNGNFGYRESVYSNNNFIGDFDVQYLLTPTGTIALKAYNETNDRYFIQSSLTTQGIGIQFKKDFNHWKDLFRRRKTKSKKGNTNTSNTK